ncbi:MAG: LysR family transcriptional regulator [Burkholderiales bacterium]|nr:LysR family transcriptional regulator [Burkholderiales bacterium]
MTFFSVDMRVLRSFVSVVETGSITETARRLGRTQPAITLQMKRLEELTGRVLFKEDSRKPVLTSEGDMVLTYAKSILKMHDELLARLSSPDIEGHVILGTPDLYAAYLLPSILALFRQAFPRIQVELRCSLSTPLLGLVQKGEVDIALVTRMPGFSGGEVVRQEQLIWVEGEGHDVHRHEPVPLALLPPGNIYRDYAIEGLERAGRKWRVACVSESVGGLQAAVFAGMAVTVLCKSALVHGMRQIGIHEYFPPLPKVDLLLYRASGPATSAAMALHDYLSRYLSGAEEIPLPETRGTTGATPLKLAPPPDPSTGPGKIRPAA